MGRTLKSKRNKKVKHNKSKRASVKSKRASVKSKRASNKSSNRYAGLGSYNSLQNEFDGSPNMNALQNEFNGPIHMPVVPRHKITIPYSNMPVAPTHVPSYTLSFYKDGYRYNMKINNIDRPNSNTIYRGTIVMGRPDLKNKNVSIVTNGIVSKIHYKNGLIPHTNIINNLKLI